MTRRKHPTVAEALEGLGIEPPRPGTIIGRRCGGDPAEECEHFYTCPACGQAVDMRDLGQVLHHEMPDHQPLPTQ